MSETPTSPDPSPQPAPRRLSPRGLAENLATALIVCGVVMMMQPLSMTLYTWSFAVTLAGTVTFVVGSKLPA
jgi:hypothetical protein